MKVTPQTTAAKWMLEGIREHEAFNRAFKTAREHAINAGFFFLSAREQFEDGAWGEFLMGYTHKVTDRAIRFYILLAAEAIEWVKHAQPKLLGMAEIQAAARELVMESPKPLVALCRELGHMRKFGEYDAVKYAARKRLGDGDGQLELGFDAVLLTIAQISRLGQPNFHLVLPEGKSEVEALDEFESNLQAALDSVHAAKIKLKQAS